MSRRKKSSVVEQLEQRRLLSAAPPLDLKFAGINSQQDTAIVGVFGPPPDCAVAAGPSNVVTVVNTVITTYSTAGVQQQQLSLNEFLGLGPPPPFTDDAPKMSDPQVVYDQSSGRFVLTVTEFDENVPQPWSKVFIAASRSSDLNDGWFVASIDTTRMVPNQNATEFIDQPRFAVAGDNIYVCGEKAAIVNGQGEGGGGRMLIIPKLPLYSSGTVSATDIDTNNIGLCPVQPYSPLPTGVGDYLTADTTVYVVSNSTSNPTVTFVGTLTPNGTGGGLLIAPAAPFKGSNILPGGEAHHPVYRNGRIYSAFTVQGPGSYGGIYPQTSESDNHEPTVIWYEYDVPTSGSQTDIANWHLADWGVEGGEDIGPNTWTGYPEVAVDAQGDLALGFTASGNNLYAGAYYAVHLATDPLHTLSATGLLHEGLGTYGDPTDVNMYNTNFHQYEQRWGDYSGMALAPDGSFWVFNEYAATPNPIYLSPTTHNPDDQEWATEIGHFQVPVIPPPPDRLPINGTDQNDHFYLYQTELPGDPQGYFFLTDTNDNGDLVGSWQIASGDIAQINGFGGNDTLTIDSTVAFNAIPDGRLFDGGTGTNQIVLKQGDGSPTHIDAVSLAQAGSRMIFEHVQSLEVDGSAQNDTLSIDESLGTIAAPGGISFDGMGGSNKITVTGSIAADTLNVSGNSATDGQFTYSVYGTTGTVAYANTAEIDYANGGSGHDSVSVAGSTPVGLPAVNAAGLNPLYFSHLSIAAGAKVIALAADSYPDRSVLVIDSGRFSLDPAGTLDITDNSMIVNDATTAHASTAAILNNLVNSGADTNPATLTPRWDGSGIISSTLISGGGSVDAYHSIGVADNATLRVPQMTFSGQSVTVASILVGYTLTGDANMDGRVSFADFQSLQSGYGQPGNWQQGDFDHNGSVEYEDFQLLLVNYGLSM